MPLCIHIQQSPACLWSKDSIFFVCAASMVGTGLPEIQSISMREGFMSVGLIRIEVSTSV